MIYSLPPKVGDTLTATVAPAGAGVTYKWTINGKGAVTTETYEVPADANSGDAIKVVVTDADGNTAEDTVYVGGFTILKVEPTTASTNNSYKYIRAYFSTSLDSLSTEDIVIRAVKSQQLHSVESVKLSSDGTYADITIAGDASVAETKFLAVNTKYGCTINHDGDEAYLEFELPLFASDLTVAAVNLAEGKITVTGSGRNGDYWDGWNTYEVGDLYEGNLGSLLGRHVNMNVNSDDQVTDFYVQDETVVTGAMELKRDNENDAMNKWYFKDQLTEKKYYLSSNSTSSNNRTQSISASEGDGLGLDFVKYSYAKLVLNPNGTVSSAVLEQTLNQVIICTSNDEGKVTQDADRAASFKGYTVVKDDEYIDPADIEEGDVVYYNTASEFADVFKTTVSGTIGNVYTTKVELDDAEYTWKGTYKTAQYLDEDAAKYKEVDQPYLIKLDDEADTTFVLDRRGEVKFILGEETGITAYTDTDYIITDTTLAYWDKGYWYVQIPVSDGTADTLNVKLSDLKTWNGNSGTYTVQNNDNTATATIAFADTDATDATNVSFAPETTATFAGRFNDAMNTYNTVLTVTSETLTGKITGLKLAAAPKETVKATGVTPDTTFQNGDTKLETDTEKYNLSDSTPIYIINKKNDGSTAWTVKKVTVADFTAATKAGQIGKVDFFTDKTSVTKVVIDNHDEAALEDAAAAYETNGIILSYKAGFNTEDQKTMELKSLKVLTPTGTFTYTDFADQIKAVAGKPLTEAAKDGDDDIDDAYVTIGFNSNDEILYINKIENESDKTYTAITASESATELKVGAVTVAAADDAVVAVRTGEGKYTATSISEINTNNKYAAAQKQVSYHKVAGDATAVQADIIVVKYVDATTVSAATISTTSPKTINTLGGNVDLVADAVAGVAFTYEEVTDADDVYTLVGSVVTLDPTVLVGSYTGTFKITATGDGVSAIGTATKTITVTSAITQALTRTDITLSRAAGETDLVVKLAADDSVTLERNTDYTLSKTNEVPDDTDETYKHQSKYVITPKGGYTGVAITVYVDEQAAAAGAVANAAFVAEKVEKAENAITVTGLGKTGLADTGTTDPAAGTAAFAVTDAENTAGYQLNITASATDGTLTYAWSGAATGDTASGGVAANLVTESGQETREATCVISCAATATHKKADDVTVVFTLNITKS